MYTQRIWGRGKQCLFKALIEIQINTNHSQYVFLCFVCHSEPCIEHLKAIHTAVVDLRKCKSKWANDHKDLDIVLEVLSEAPGKRMKKLLTKYGVRYEDLSSLDADIESWEGPWDLYTDKNASDQARVQALVSDRWYRTGQRGDVFIDITAARTLEDL